MIKYTHMIRGYDSVKSAYQWCNDNLESKSWSHDMTVQELLGLGDEHKKFSDRIWISFYFIDKEDLFAFMMVFP